MITQATIDIMQFRNKGCFVSEGKSAYTFSLSYNLAARQNFQVYTLILAPKLNWNNF